MSKIQLKKTSIIVMLFGAALFMDSNSYLGEVNSEAVQAGTFLGTGVKVEESGCFQGTMVVTRTVVVFGIQVGESWQTEEPC